MALIDRAGAVHDWGALVWRGPDGSPLTFTDLRLGAVPSPTERDRTVWRWRDWFPVPIGDAITLGEGDTPLVDAPWLGANVHLKLDHLNPTGSFKDRGVALVVAALRSAGATRLLEDSSGNGGSSMAAYAAAAGVTARVLVPDGTSSGKIAATRAYGAEIVLVPGSRDDTSAEALRQVGTGNWAYASHAWHPLFPVGVATQALEIWAQLGRAPETVVVVAGGGSMVLGHDLAWRALLAAGLIEALPRLVMVQPAACAPLVLGPVVTPGKTLAEGTAIARPVRDAEVSAALRRLDGIAVATDEAAIAQATRQLVAHGHYVEPTSANAVAGWQAVATGQIAPGTTVIVLTGSGHKTPDAMASIFAAVN